MSSPAGVGGGGGGGRDDGRGFLILRRGGILWGIDNAAVAGLTRHQDRRRFRIDMGIDVAGRPLAADDILCVVDGLRVWPLAPAVRWFWPGDCAGVSGMAVHGEQPLLVVDPRQPPRRLWLEEGEGNDGEGRE